MSERVSLKPLITATFLSLIAFGMMVPLLPVFARGFGADGLAVGLLLSLNQAVDFFFAPVAGHWSDRIGRRWLLSGTFALLTVAYFFVGLVPSLTLLIVVWTVAGFGSAQILLTQAYIADATSEGDRTRAMGLWGSAFAIGFVIGPPLGTTLYSIDPLIAASVAAGFSALAFVVAVLFVREPERKQAGEPEGTSLLTQFKRVVVVVIVLYLMLVLVWSQVTTMLALLTEDEFHWGVRQYGMYLGLVGLIAALVQGRMIGPLAKRFGRKPLVVVGFALMGVGLLLLVMLPPNAQQVLSAIPIAIGFGILTPTLPAVLSSEVLPSRRGSALGVFQSVGTLGRVVAPLIAGILYEGLSHTAPFLSAAAISLGMAGMALPTLLKKRPGR